MHLLSAHGTKLRELDEWGKGGDAYGHVLCCAFSARAERMRGGRRGPSGGVSLDALCCQYRRRAREAKRESTVPRALALAVPRRGAERRVWRVPCAGCLFPVSVSFVGWTCSVRLRLRVALWPLPRRGHARGSEGCR